MLIVWSGPTELRLRSGADQVPVGPLAFDQGLLPTSCLQHLGMHWYLGGSHRTPW